MPISGRLVQEINGSGCQIPPVLLPNNSGGHILRLRRLPAPLRMTDKFDGYIAEVKKRKAEAAQASPKTMRGVPEQQWKYPLLRRPSRLSASLR